MIRKIIAFLFLLSGICFGQATQIDSMPNFISAVYRGGTFFKIGVLTDFYGLMFSSSTGAYRVSAVTFSCTDSGELPESIIDSEVFAAGTDGTNIGTYPAALQIPNTNYFLGSWSFDGTGDSTWVFIFEIDTTDATFGETPIIDKKIIKLAPTRMHTLLQVGSSNYFALSASTISPEATWLKTFLIDPGTPAIVDVTVDSLILGGKIIDIDRVAKSDFYVVPIWGVWFTANTYQISEADGSIGSLIESKDIGQYNLPSPGSHYSNTAHVNDTVFIANTSKYISSFSVNPLDGDISVSAYSVIEVQSYGDGFGPSIAANDSAIVVFYSGYWLDYDAYLASLTANQVSGALTIVQPEIQAFSDNLTGAAPGGFFSSSRMITRDSRNVLMVYRGATPFYGCMRTMELPLPPSPYWPHSRCGVAGADISEISGTAIEDIQEVSGVEK